MASQLNQYHMESLLQSIFHFCCHTVTVLCIKLYADKFNDESDDFFDDDDSDSEDEAEAERVFLLYHFGDPSDAGYEGPHLYVHPWDDPLNPYVSPFRTKTSKRRGL